MYTYMYIIPYICAYIIRMYVCILYEYIYICTRTYISHYTSVRTLYECMCVYYMNTYVHVHVCTFTETSDVTGWRRLVGSPKLQIISHKTATKYRSLLWKMTYQDKGSYGSSPPCSRVLWPAAMQTHLNP